MMSIRTSFVLLATALVLFAGGPVIAQPYPARPVRVVVPFPPGGPADNLARPVLQKLSEALGQSFVIENRSGAGGNIGADAVAKAAPDGYTVLMGATFLAFNRATMKGLAYDSLTDLAPVPEPATVALFGLGLAAVVVARRKAKAAA